MSRVRVPSLTPKVRGCFSPLTFFFPGTRCNVATLSRPEHLPLGTNAPKAKPLAEFDYYTNDDDVLFEVIYDEAFPPIGTYLAK
jgi:hypothetical protein